MADNNDPIVILSYARTPMGGFQGDFASLSASELGGFDVLELNGAGHLANIERPTEFNELLSDFLQRV